MKTYIQLEFSTFFTSAGLPLSTEEHLVRSLSAQTVVATSQPGGGLVKYGSKSD